MKRDSGLAFHCRHDQLAEWVWSYKERVAYIKESKPKKEQETRMRLFKLIPLKYVPRELREAQGAYDKARGAYSKAHPGWIEELHKQLCPDCPWDGKTIFPKARGK